MELIDTQQAAILLNLSPRHVRTLCEEGRIRGAQRVGGNKFRGSWVIPLGKDGLFVRPKARHWKEGLDMQSNKECDHGVALSGHCRQCDKEG